ncbi:MAG: lipopolysaccharide biosynthesis protein [Saprospiraceae bacterium]|nr:lipopolysaccharide biosynthesis protein [Saprospiraceae bacterium]
MLIKNILWDYVGRFSLLFANLAVTSVLSRLLSPAEYGEVGIVIAISGLAAILLEFGFTAAIIQKKEIDEVQLSTIFYMVLLGSSVIYAVVFVAAPYVAAFYGLPNLSALLRVSALTFLINAFNLVPSALITRNMMFKQQSIRNVALTVAVGMAAITLAWMGWGVWALVLQMLLSAFFLVFINLWLTKWLPARLFNLRSVAEMFHYSKFLFLSTTIDALFTRADALIIGKALDVRTVGFFSRSKGMENMVQGVTTASLNAVMFPFFSKMQHDEGQIRSLFHRFFAIITTVIFLFTGLAYVNAFWVFELLFGAQWGVSAGYYRILALSAFAFPLSALILSVVSARGNSKDFFRAEIIKKLIFLPTFFFIFIGVEAFLYAWVVANFLAFGVNLQYLTRSIPVYAAHYWSIVLRFSLILACFLVAYHTGLPVLGFSEHSFAGAIVASLLFVPYFVTAMYLLVPEPFQLARDQFFQLKNQIEGRFAAR